MKKRKICVVITARPSYSRVKTALTAINNHPKLELQLILAGSSLLDRYGSVQHVVESDGFTVLEKIYNVIEGDSPSSMAKTTGLGIVELSTAFQSLKPDVVVTIADRFETIATSIAASYQNITLAHIQGGEVTGNIDEKVRHANTKFADIHLVASADAHKRVLRLGEDPGSVITTGCPSMDIAKVVLENPDMDFNPQTKYGGVGANIPWENGYLVVMQHPVTTEIESSRQHAEETMSAIVQLDLPTFWFWPNVDSGSDGTALGIRAFREKYELPNLRFFKNMAPIDFLRLLKNSLCLVGNSSVGIRECAFLGVPVVNIGSRQNRRQKSSSVIECGYNQTEISNAINKQLSNSHYEPDYIYGDGTAGQKIAEALATCTLMSHKTITY
jgi:UDP-hydrolysing UDP-N-acetyl-D-glucosamine 2-epimerase